MKIIDAHFHLFEPSGWANAMARRIGHENTAEHLLAYYRAHGFVHGIIMGNQTLAPDSYLGYPPQFSYCVGLDSGVMADLPKDGPALAEEHLKRPGCVGIKLYPGYSPVYISDAMFEPYYALAQKYGKPVAIHMGQTAGSRAKLKYSHPLTLDEVAADHPKVQFVMCHIGNPFLADAAAVLEKNPNVAADLSGLIEGPFAAAEHLERQRGYWELVRTWLTYVDDWSKFMFGTDWPVVNLAEYAKLIAALIPEREREKVFFDNADRIYQLGLH